MRYAMQSLQGSSDLPVTVTVEDALQTSSHESPTKSAIQVKELYTTGNSDQLTYPRSALKFVQILPLLETGACDYYNFTDEEVAVMCASHSSQTIHLAVVRGILAKIGLNESELKCGGHQPMHSTSAYQYIREGESEPHFKNGIFNNCSGKHAGFLALCKFLGLSTHDYLDRSHPIQKMIYEYVKDVFHVNDNEVVAGVDGCSAPTYAIPIRNAAIGFAKLCYNNTANEDGLDFFPPSRRKAINHMI